MSIDKVSFNIISNGFLAIAREMSADLLRTAYSTVIREAADASTCLIDSKGRILAQAVNIPLHLNSVSPAIQGCLKEIPLESLTEDDVIILNDPYNGGQHQSDIYLFSPILNNGRVIGFSGSVGHYIDLGHSPGFNLLAPDIFAERMRFTAMKFSYARDWNGGLLEKIIRANVRVPRDTIGDMNAQLTANFTGRKRFKELITRYGVDKVMEIAERFIEYVAQQMREAIIAVPDGIYEGEDVIDDDGINDRPVLIKTTVTVDGDRIAVDFAGTNEQVKTAINCPWASTTSSAMSVLKMILTEPSLPLNDGCYRNIKITAPKGTIVNPLEYAPVEGRNVIVMRIFQAIQLALSRAIPDKVPAPGYDTRTEVTLRWNGPDGYHAESDLYGGGYGAGPHNDGADQLDDPLGNCKNTPVEVLEVTQDFFRILAYELRTDSGGAGRTRGGLGAYRKYEILEDDVYMTVYSDRFRFPAKGLFGGHDGTCSYIKIKRARSDKEEYLKPKGENVLHKGDILEIGIGGGAGYGKPLERNRENLQADLITGKVSKKAAKNIYGY
ncbi:MAG TPA: hydantoinase B/oxoprolinase family protein [Spirochaetes bacterium]|nr:hydantoinase B/oxoprolinase family protein [Spirochaetota bacterium]